MKDEKQKELLNFIKSNSGLTTVEIWQKLGYKDKLPLYTRLNNLNNRSLIHSQENRWYERKQC